VRTPGGGTASVTWNSGTGGGATTGVVWGWTLTSTAGPIQTVMVSRRPPPVRLSCVPTGQTVTELWDSKKLTNNATLMPGAVKFTVPTVVDGYILIGGGSPGYFGTSSTLCPLLTQQRCAHATVRRAVTIRALHRSRVPNEYAILIVGLAVLVSATLLLAGDAVAPAGAQISAPVSFAKAITFPSPLLYPSSLAAGDLNTTVFPDLAVVSAENTANLAYALGRAMVASEPGGRTRTMILRLDLCFGGCIR